MTEPQQQRTADDIRARLGELYAMVETEKKALATAVLRENLSGHVRDVYARFIKGNYLVRISARHWWCHSGDLIEQASANDLDAAHELQAQGLIGQQTITHRI